MRVMIALLGLLPLSACMGLRPPQQPTTFCAPHLGMWKCAGSPGEVYLQNPGMM